MKLKDIGEFGLIDKLKKEFKTGKSVFFGIGDDAAVIKYTRNEYLLLASDMLIEDVHFKITGGKDIFKKIGHKALACNISDIACMGGVPKYALVNLGIRPGLEARKAFDFFSGIRKTAEKFGVSVIGGDLSRSNKVIACVNIAGFVKKKNLTLRSTAQAGDVIFVTGPLGGSAGGRHLSFTPRLKEAQYLLKKYKINSMIDISDGLVQDLWQITKASRKGAVLYEEFLPLAREAKDINSALYDGEDYELLFTVSPDTAGKIVRDRSLRAYMIGGIFRDEKAFKLVFKSGREKNLKRRGYRHF